MMMNFSESCVRNQQPIFDQLHTTLSEATTVLEIGSGSGQHAIFFSQQLPHLQWQCSDQRIWLEGLQHNLIEAKANLNNTLAPFELDINKVWPDEKYDVIYTANSLHIMSWDSVKTLFKQLPFNLHEEGTFCCYGPFKYRGEFTSESNESFDRWLKARDIQSGIRDIEGLIEVATASGLQLVEDVPMPANNQLLFWKKID